MFFEQNMLSFQMVFPFEIKKRGMHIGIPLYG